MKKKFSISWKASSQIRKQRKYLANAPLHTQNKMMSGNLNKELRKKYGKRSFPIRKDDEVKIMKGKFKGKMGKITTLDRARRRVSIEGLTSKKKDGTKTNIYFDSSNLQIQKLNLDDKKRVKGLERKTQVKKIEKKIESNLEKKMEKKQ